MAKLRIVLQQKLTLLFWYEKPFYDEVYVKLSSRCFVQMPSTQFSVELLAHTLGFWDSGISYGEVEVKWWCSVVD